MPFNLKKNSIGASFDNHFITLYSLLYIKHRLLMNSFSKTILYWYHSHGRDLPWRHTSDPYCIWLSEIILQQTRVEQGREYYLRFIERFPNVASLAAASEDEVLHLWQGLGYYSRARNMHEAAIDMKGTFPSSYQQVLALKGIGPYTAAAICSIAFNMPYAVVDGNVYRVLARYFGIDAPIDSTAGKKMFAQLADSLLDTKVPGQYNEALMDFGALQCSPAAPTCNTCPLVDSCIAFEHDKVMSLPVKTHRPKLSHRYFNYLYIRSENTIWLHKRNNNDIWRNLYELPLIESDTPLDTVQLLQNKSFVQLFANISEKVNIKHITSVKHQLTHRIIHTDFYLLSAEGKLSLPNTCISIPADEWQNYAMPQLIYHFLEKIEE